MAATERRTFTCEDGRELQIVPGFRERVLTYRRSVSPRPEWSDEDYAHASEKKLRRGQRLIKTIREHFGELQETEILEIGCGDSLNSFFIALEGVKKLVGIDIDMRIRQTTDAGDRVRRQVSGVLSQLGIDGQIEDVLQRLSIKMITMDATEMTFDDDSFDFLISRSAMEHIKPIEKALDEMARVVRPGGMIHHSIDPFYWIRGCHKRGVVDIPWAHARLGDDDFHRFVDDEEGRSRAKKALGRIQTLNRLSLDDWRRLIDSGKYEVVHWAEPTSDFSEQVLAEYPDAAKTLLEGVEEKDLVTSRIDVWLRVK